MFNFTAKLLNKNLGGSQLYTAFTLAEVLITLGIIGIVAAMTIPTLMNQTNNQELITGLKKAYSELSQAYTLAVNENGTPDNWGLTTDGPSSAITMIHMLTPYLKVTKDCGLAVGCFPDTNYKTIGNATDMNWDTPSSYSKIMLADGSLLAISSWSMTCSMQAGTSDSLLHVCGSAFIDVNGFKKPNKSGVDFFYFYITKNGIIPRGTALETNAPFTTYCDKNNAGLLYYTNGGSCTAWALYNENMDYMKCNTLSWNGPTKCN